MTCPTCQADEAMWRARERERFDEAFRHSVELSRVYDSGWNDAVDTCREAVRQNRPLYRCDFEDILAALKRLKRGTP